MSNANTVTKDFLLFSQPVIHEGALLSSTGSGRRLYIHHLSEVPVAEDFTTRVGNHLHRVDKCTVQLAGTITLDVADVGSPLVPSVKTMAAIPVSTFTGPVGTRDQKVLELLSSGKSANAAEDFGTACACFEAAYALSVRAGMVVSAANMRLKLAQARRSAAVQCLRGVSPRRRCSPGRQAAQARASPYTRACAGAPGRTADRARHVPEGSQGPGAKDRRGRDGSAQAGRGKGPLRREAGSGWHCEVAL